MDSRMKLVSEIKGKLTFLEAAEANEVIDLLTVTLKGYNVEEIGTELVVYDDQNQKILNRYMACLCIDGKSEKTAYQYKRTAQKLALCVGKHFTDMTTFDLRFFLASEKARGLSNTTLENTRANVSAFFQWMAVEDLIDKNPCLAIKPIKTKEEVRFPFSSVELDLLRSACRTEKERALIEFLASSGVRVSELTSMELGDVDVQSLTVHVRHGKGGKERTTYINEVAKEHLLKYITGRPEKGMHLFYNGKHQPIAPGGVRHILKQIAERAGVTNVHPHRFRRTFATGLAARGMQIQEIQRLLGHSRLDTTMEYVCVSDERVHASYRQYIA